MIKINPFDVILWTFRRNENDVVNLYNVLSPVMQIASGGNMLNFGYWDGRDTSPIKAQKKLCDIVGNMAELDSAKSLLDIGSGLSSPALRWASSYPEIKIVCVNINYLQLQTAKNHLKQGISNFSIYEINSTSTMLPFSKNSVDRIIALESAQHFKPFKDFISESISEQELLSCIKKTYENLKMIIDPHTAVGLGALEKINLAGKSVVLSTAHPCKFPEAIKKAINIKSELPDNLNYILSKKENFIVMNNDIEEVKKYILNKLI